MLAETSFKFAGKQVLMQGISQDDWIFYLIFNNKMFYEIDLLKYMRFTLKKCDGYILDVGANIGNHSVFFGLIMEKPARLRAGFVYDHHSCLVIEKIIDSAADIRKKCIHRVKDSLYRMVCKNRQHIIAARCVDEG